MMRRKRSRGLVVVGYPPVVVLFRAPANPKRPTLREVAELLLVAREGEAMRIHSVADGCEIHGRAARSIFRATAELLPKWAHADAHRLILAPAAREYARLADEHAGREA